MKNPADNNSRKKRQEYVRSLCDGTKERNEFIHDYHSLNFLRQFLENAKKEHPEDFTISPNGEEISIDTAVEIFDNVLMAYYNDNDEE